MKTGKFIGLCVLVFIVFFVVGIMSKSIKGSWAKKYSLEMMQKY